MAEEDMCGLGPVGCVHGGALGPGDQRDVYMLGNQPTMYAAMPGLRLPPPHPQRHLVRVPAAAVPPGREPVRGHSAAARRTELHQRHQRPPAEALLVCARLLQLLACLHACVLVCVIMVGG